MTPLRIAAVFGFLAVALGAFGAHGLKPRLIELGTQANWETAAHYHLVHAAVLLGLALANHPGRWAFRCFAGGIVVFSGSLYVLSVTGQKWLGAITPLGGLALLAGWALLALTKK